MSDTRNKPAKSFAYGPIEVAVWANEGRNSTTFYSVTAKRSYTADDGATWRESGSFKVHQLPALSMALLDAMNWIQRQPK